MPQIFAPNVALDPNPQSNVSATSVDPMHNEAPQQQEQVGGAVQQFGETAGNIAERIEWQQDDAATKVAETQFLQQAQQVIHGDGTADNPGYLNTRGQNAIDSYGGAAEALAKAKQDGLDGLTNNFQKMMFNRVATQHLTNFGAQMADHHFQQGTEFAMQAADDRATMSGLMAANAWKNWNQTDADGKPIGDFNTFSAVRDQEILAAQKQKIGTDDPDTPQNQFALLQARSTTAKTSLAQMITAGAPASDVQGFFDAMKDKGYIDPRDEVTMASAVKSYTLPKILNDNMNQAFADAYRKNHPGAKTQGPTDYAGPIKGAGFTNSPFDEDAGGVHITIPQNTPVNAPGDGTVSEVGQDDSGTPMVSIQHADGSTSTLTGMSTFNVKAGDTVKQGQRIGTSGDEGSQDGASVLWQLEDKDGNAVDPTHAGLPPVSPLQITDEKDLTDALNIFRDREQNPDQQRQGTNEMEATVRHNQSMLSAAATQLHSQAANYFYKNYNWHDIPAAIFTQLPAEQQQKFKDEQTEHVLQQYHQGQEFKTMSETDIVSDLYANPDRITTDNVEAARPQLSNSTYLQLMNRAQELAKHPENVVEASGVNDRIKYFAAPAGVNVEPKSPADKQTLVDLTYKVNNAIDQIKAQNKGKATPEQVDKAIQQLVIQHSTVTPRSPWSPLRVLGINPNSTTTQYNFQSAPKVGDTRTFPNGKTGTWDGTGWAAQ